MSKATRQSLRKTGQARWRVGRLFKRALPAMVTGFLAGLLLLYGFRGQLALLSYDLLFAVRPAQSPSEEVLIVYMDDESHRNLGQAWDKPWDRALHARLLDRLRIAGTRAVVFDVLFDSPNPSSPTADRALVEAAKRTPHLFLAAILEEKTRFEGEIETVTLIPFEDLRAVSRWGLVEGAGPPQRIRTHLRERDSLPTLSSLIATTLTDEGTSADRRQPAWINYYAAPMGLPWKSYHEVLDPTLVPNHALSNKVVFIGARPLPVGMTGGRVVDDFQTPFTLWTRERAPGVEVLATTYLNLARGECLTRSGSAVELAMITVTAICLALIFTRLRPFSGLLLAGFLVVATYLVAAEVCWSRHVWFPWMAISAGQIPLVLAATWARKRWVPKKIFVSYSSKDRDEVFKRLQGMKQVHPELIVFMDCLSIRTGEQWKQRLQQEIRRCDRFFLFWSRNAAKSPQVEREWRLALDEMGLEGIQPVPLEHPEQVPPPPELQPLHFADVYLAVRHGGGGDSQNHGTQRVP